MIAATREETATTSEIRVRRATVIPERSSASEEMTVEAGVVGH
jgi:hypothetical protein